MKRDTLSRKGIGVVPLILALVVVLAVAILLYRSRQTGTEAGKAGPGTAAGPSGFEDRSAVLPQGHEREHLLLRPARRETGGHQLLRDLVPPLPGGDPRLRRGVQQSTRGRGSS